jgi:hypothetical protein
MPTSYPGREDEHDLGQGHSFAWYSDEQGVFGLIEHHPPGPDAQSGARMCGGYVAWRQPVPPNGHTAVNHQLIAGAPGEEASLTVAPSLLCRTCGNHGFIREGRWVPA